MKEASQDETSEIFIGEWMEKRGIRDQVVIATKVSIPQYILMICIQLNLTIL